MIKVVLLTAARGLRANPDASFYILPYYFIYVFQFSVLQPFIIQLIIYLYLFTIKNTEYILVHYKYISEAVSPFLNL